VSWVSQVERGVKPLDRLSVLCEVARVLEVAPADLLPEELLPARKLAARPPTLAEALSADPKLSPAARDLLLSVYRLRFCATWATVTNHRHRSSRAAGRPPGAPVSSGPTTSAPQTTGG
jgi:hypothetical protein